MCTHPEIQFLPYKGFIYFLLFQNCGFIVLQSGYFFVKQKLLKPENIVKETMSL